MATINSNKLGVYSLETAQDVALQVLVSASGVTSLTDATVAAAGVAVGEYFLLVTSANAFTGIGKRASGASAPTDETSELTLLGMSTSSTLEASNSITETASRDGVGGSTNTIISGAMSWSTSVEGLLDVTSGSGSAINIMDAARSKYYLIAKFNINESTSVYTFYAGQGLIDSISLTGGVDDVATYSASLTGFGSLYKG